MTAEIFWNILEVSVTVVGTAVRTTITEAWPFLNGNGGGGQMGKGRGREERREGKLVGM